MEDSTKALLLGAAVVIVCVIIGIAFYIAREAKHSAAKGIEQIVNITGEFEESSKVIYDGTTCTGAEVVKTIEKFWEDTTMEIVVVTKDAAKTSYCTGTVVPDADLTNVQTESTNAVPATATKDQKIGYKRKTLSSTVGYINPNGSFTGSIQKDSNRAIRRITFIQN